MDRPLRIALLSYRGNPLSGGQGVYVHYLSSALKHLGHDVEVFSGPPYPELEGSIRLTRIPSLDLYRPDDHFRRPARSEFRDWVDVLEYASMCGAEPLTFSLRAARLLKKRHDDFDLVHDNQCLGYGLLQIARSGLPVVATVHHPVQIDRKLEISAADRKRRMALRRWYAFTRMQSRVARRLPIISPSSAAASEVIKEMGVDPSRIAVVPNGVDAELFRPIASVTRVPGRIVTTASADVPLKGLIYLIEGLAKLRTEIDAHLVVVGPQPKRRITDALGRYGVEDHVTFRTGIDRLELVELYSSSQVAVVPSLYEGFSLPAVEAMSCAVPVVATTAGALPEVVGRTGAGALVPPADAGALAGAIRDLLLDANRRRSIGESGRRRVLERFTWRKAAELTVARYREVLASC
ncbi:MAG: glycosyltransferase family 4 protein [Actinomycetota bacterium]|nr:glycosyltransferase family 4 protein [Actinomycetota bacterium]